MRNNAILLPILLLLAACSASPSAERKAVSYPDMQSDGYARFADYCAQCHMPPQPNAHTAHEWVQVVRRMQRHRVERGLGAIPDADVKLLTDYLTRHARSES